MSRTCPAGSRWALLQCSMHMHKTTACIGMHACIYGATWRVGRQLHASCTRQGQAIMSCMLFAEHTSMAYLPNGPDLNRPLPPDTSFTAQTLGYNTYYVGKFLVAYNANNYNNNPKGETCQGQQHWQCLGQEPDGLSL
jgi:hypothetical protein